MTTGLVLGKFLPPHLGHCYLVEFARRQVDHLTVLIGSLRREPIPGELRAAWLRELFPLVRVVHTTDENPQVPEDHPRFWQCWLRTIRVALPTGPDFVFASEPYGFALAELLGARYVPADHARELVPVSGSALRAAPMKHFDYLPPPVRPYFVQRVCIFGPESTGKTTLAQKLARAYQTAWVAEYARPLLALQNDQCFEEDILRIVRGQIASEEALARQANRLLFCDTDPLTTVFWAETLFGRCPAWIRAEAARRRYPLTLLCDVDLPWKDDPQRYLPDNRKRTFKRFRELLEQHKRPYALVQGSGEARLNSARAAVDAFMAQQP